LHLSECDDDDDGVSFGDCYCLGVDFTCESPQSTLPIALLRESIVDISGKC